MLGYVLPRPKNNSAPRVLLFLFVLASILFVIIHTLLPIRLVNDVTVSIPSGYSISQTAMLLQEEGVIRNARFFSLYQRFQDQDVKSGSYLFEKGSHSFIEVAQRLNEAEYGDVFVRITIPEGSHNREIADILVQSDLQIDKEEFLVASNDLEGYLFPDTYLLLPDANIEEVIEKMNDNFEDKIATLDFPEKGRTLEEYIIMASLIEKEATSDLEEMKIISGILWKRLDQGIPLQVDAPFKYRDDKTSSELTISDLRTDGPYNTYTNKGLTPTAIGNPGLLAIEAAMYPIDSPYLFYLHGNDGIVRYGVTHDDHVVNKRRYLP